MGVLRVKFQPHHLDLIKEQKATAYLSAWLEKGYGAQLAATPHSYSLIVDERVQMCCGVAEVAPGRGVAWAIVDENCKPHFLALHNEVRRFLDECPFRRVEATVDAEFAAGHRWVQALGFSLEAPEMKSYRPDGGSSSLYARIKWPQ